MSYLQDIPAYVYKITCMPTNEFYIGYRYANIAANCPPENDLWVIYFTSSKYVSGLISQYGKDQFKVEIIYTNHSPHNAFCYEQGLIKENWGDPLLINKKCYDTESMSEMFMHSQKGRHWFTNGIDEDLVYEPPNVNWTRGRLPNKNPPLKTTKGLSWYHQGLIERMFSDYPGLGWTKGRLPGKYRSQYSNKGLSWFNNGVQETFASSPPSNTWVLGRLPGRHKPPSQIGQRWWTDGTKQCKSRTCPGSEWTLGQLKRKGL